PSHLNDLVIGEGYGWWDGSKMAAASPLNISVSPVLSVLASQPVGSPELQAYRTAAFGPFVFTITDSQGNPVNLLGKTVSFVVWNRSRQEALWKIANCPISGDDSNIVTVEEDDANTGTAGSFYYTLWNETDDVVLAT